MFQPDKLADLISKDRCAGPKEYTIERLAAWLEKKPPDCEYDFTKPNQCLIAQAFGLCNLFSDQIDTATFPGADDIAAFHPWTFGAALERTRAAIKAMAAQ